MNAGGIRTVLLATSCGIAASVLYWSTVGAQFVWDDPVLIVANRDLAHWQGLLDCFTGSIGTGSGVVYYRPLLMVSYLFDREIWGLDPRGFHLTNVLLHGFDTALVFLLAARYVGRPFCAAVGALCFALHPIQAQAVSLVLGRNDLLLVPPVIGILLLGRRGRPLVPMMLLYAAALWTKETGVLAPFLLYAADVLVAPNPTRGDRRWVALAIGFTAVAALYFVVRYEVLGSLARLPAGPSLPWTERLVQPIAVFGYYVRHVLVPVGLSPVPYSPRLARAPGVLGSAAVCLAFALAIGYGLRKHKTIAYGLLFFLVAALPVLPMLPMLLPILEHRLYLPMVGVALAVAASSRDVGERSSAAVAFPALAACALATLMRLPVFHDDLALWSNAVDRVPDSAYARSGYALALGRMGRGQSAIAEYREAIRLDPDFGKSRYELALALEREGEREEAFRTIEELLRRDPNDVAGWNALAYFWKKSDDLRRSETALRRGLLVAPENAVLLGNLLALLAEEGRGAEAEQIAEELLKIDPQNAAALRQRGQLRDRSSVRD